MYVRTLFAILILAFGLAVPTRAQQQQPDPQFLQRAIASVQTQRNLALDAQAVAEAKIVGLTEDLTKAQARIKELELRPDPAKKDE